MKRRLRWSKNLQLEGATIQRVLEPGSRGIAIAQAVTRKVLVKTLRPGKDVVSMFCHDL
jgi:hypothetical protein